MESICYQPELSPALRVVVGNVDYSEFRATLERSLKFFYRPNISGAD